VAECFFDPATAQASAWSGHLRPALMPGWTGRRSSCRRSRGGPGPRMITHSLGGGSGPGGAAAGTTSSERSQPWPRKGAQAATTVDGEDVGAALGASSGTAIVPVLGMALGALARWVVSPSFVRCNQETA